MRGVPVLRRPSSALSRRSFLRVNGVDPKTSADTTPLPPPQIAAGGKAFTAQVMCVRVGRSDVNLRTVRLADS